MPGDAVAMSKKKDDDEVPEHVRKTQEQYLADVKSGKKDLSGKPDHYAIDWETGEPLTDPKYQPPKS